MRDFLSAEGISFTEKNVSDSAVREEMIAKFGRMATPLAVIGGKRFWGFAQNRAEIEKLVREMKK
ncbi:MAG TPA: glutaredoxin family protein [Thermodesulfovibrionales bacterium]|nr:glutaredoxin family protein [Thermodesulfovibrionales bacterium]